jgi:hypothetical protein
MDLWVAAAGISAGRLFRCVYCSNGTQHHHHGTPFGGDHWNPAGSKCQRPRTEWAKQFFWVEIPFSGLRTTGILGANSGSLVTAGVFLRWVVLADRAIQR